MGVSSCASDRRAYRKGVRNHRDVLLVFVALLGVWSCGGVNATASTFEPGDDDDPQIPAGSGFIEVSVATTNPPPGVLYVVAISNGQKQTTAPNATLNFTTTRTGTHEIVISSVPAVCTLAGTNPVAVSVRPLEHVSVGFSITCPGPAS